MIFEKAVVNMYKSMMHSRCDDTETVFYFSPDDFVGLRCERFEFPSSLGHALVGYIYSYEGADERRIVVFDHGFGGGHRAYMKEIEKLCSHGFKVLSYDHTGCMKSGGKTPRGLAQSLCDLNDCINALKDDGRFSGLDISVVGHSWGAFSTMNIAALHPEISHIVAISGFVSVEEMINTFFSGLLKGYRKAIMKLEMEANPVFSKFSAVETLSKSDVKALLIYSSDDKMCRPVHYYLLKNALKDKANAEFIFVNNRGHNPNYTEDAVKRLAAFGAARAKLLKKRNRTKEETDKFISSFDWHAITAQDELLWDKIFAHLDL